MQTLTTFYLHERLRMFTLVGGFTVAVVALILFLIKWNNMLNRQVKRRTKELEESYEQLEAMIKCKESLSMYEPMS